MVDAEFDSPDFSRYIEYMTPLARRVARRRSRDHPLLSREDQTAYALEVCLQVWLHYRRTRPGAPPETLYPIAVTAMDRRLRRQQTHATKGGEAGVVVMPLDAPLRCSPDGGLTLADVLASPAPDPAPSVSTLWAVARVEVRRRLSADEHAVLRELLYPSDRTLEITRRIWERDLPRLRCWNWQNARLRVVAASLRWPLTRVRRAYQRMRSAVHVVPASASDAGAAVIVYTTKQRGKSAPEAPACIPSYTV